MDGSMEKAKYLYGLLQPTLGKSMPHNEVAQWANALAIQAGAVLGLLHRNAGVPTGMDKRALDALREYAKMGVKLGRQG